MVFLNYPEFPIFAVNFNRMAHEQHSNQQKPGLWYTYFGKGGAAVFAFLWIIALLTWIISVLRWG